MLLIKKIFRKLTDRKWNIGFFQGQLDSVIKGTLPKISWLKHNCKDRWFADPFILKMDDKYIYVLVEELFYPLGRGRIARLKVDRETMTLITSEPVLTVSTHLSFPAIIRENGKIYIYPENGASGELVLFEYDFEKNSVAPVKQLSNEKLGDAVITTYFNEKLMFCTVYPNYNKDELWIYRETEGGNFVRHEQVSFGGDNIARMAGDFFEYKGLVYRVAQNCNDGYGRGLVLQMVSCIDKKWKFEDVARFESPNKKMNLGFHTFNTYDNMTVVDTRGYWHPVVGPILDGIRKFFK